MSLGRLSRWLAFVFVALLVFATLRHWNPVRVAGESMRPALLPGDLCLVDAFAEPVKGDIALLSTPGGGRFLHRVTAVEADGAVHTKGDANAIADFELTPQANVVGPVVRVVPIGVLLDRWRGHPSLRYTFRSNE